MNDTYISHFKEQRSFTVDYFTKWAEAYPLEERVATAVAQAIVNNWFMTHGVPMKLHCDNAAEFRSQVMRELKSILGIRGTFITPYRPKSNGLCERTNGTIEAMIMCLIEEKRKDWDRVLPFVLGAYRATPHTTTGYSPNMMVHGREIQLPCDLMYGSTAQQRAQLEYQCHCEYVTQLRRSMVKSHEMARRTSKLAAVRQRRGQNDEVKPRKFRLGDVVWFFEKRLSSKPLCMGWTGPFVITAQTGAANYRLQRVEGGRNKVVHVDNLRLHNDQSAPNWVKERVIPPEKATQTVNNSAPAQRGAEKQNDPEMVIVKEHTNPLLRRSSRLARKRRKYYNLNVVVKLNH